MIPSVQADPGRVLDADQVGAALQAHHEARLTAGRRGA
jgi:hypothetical protein